MKEDAMFNSREVKRYLGRVADTHRSSDLRLASYMGTRLRAEREPRFTRGLESVASGQCPASPSWPAFLTPKGMKPTPDRDSLGNNYKGDCVFAAPGHHVNMIGQQTGDSQLVVTTEMVDDEYIKRTGYNPVTGANDNGYVIRDMIKIWSTEGLYGTKCLAACAVDITNQEEIEFGIWCGCGLIGGYDLPEATETQYDAQGRAVWSIPKGGFANGDYPGKRGGHCMYNEGTSPGADNYNSWGEPVTSLPSWRLACCSELWLVFIDRWIQATGRAPNGLALQDMISDWNLRV